MTQEFARQILDAVKQDNLAEFTRLVQENSETFAIRFGNMPLLSVCYMYNSRAILKQYNEKLAVRGNYVDVCEDFEIYRTFKRIAGRCIRLYNLTDNLVSPPEMLALMNQRNELQSIYPAYANDRQIRHNLDKIFHMRYAETVTQENKSFKCKRGPLTRGMRSFVAIVAVMAVLVIAFSSVIGGYIESTYGVADSGVPYKITNATMFSNAIKHNLSNIELQEDITLSDWTPVNYSGNIIGGGHTITIPSGVAGVFSKFSGKMENVKIVVDNYNYQITQDGALFVNVNEGTIDNVSMTIRGEWTEAVNFDGDLTQTLMYSMLTYENKGTISNCNIFGNIVFRGDGDGNATFALFSAKNSGAIKNCTTDLDSSIESYLVDVAVFVSENQSNGTIDGCENNCSLYQESPIEGWNPNVTGIVWDNYGTVSNSTNNGEVKAITGANSASAVSIAAGIAINNYGYLSLCHNTAEVRTFAQSSGGSAVSAGVVYNNEGITNDCTNNGLVVADTACSGSSTVAIAGGLVASNKGEINSCINYSEVTTSSTATSSSVTLYSGGVAGINNSLLIKCSNSGQISAESESANLAIAYSGGIVATNNTGYSSTLGISNCINSGSIVSSVVASSNSYAFGGGVAAYSYGIIVDCIAYGGTSSNGGTAKLGVVIGVVEIPTLYVLAGYFNWTNYYLNNDFLDVNSSAIPVGSILGNSTLYDSFEYDGFNAVTSLDEIMESERYWL